MSPWDYLRRYQELEVPIVANEKVSRWQPVKIGNYVLVVGHDAATGAVTWDANHGKNQGAHDNMLGKLRDHFAKKGATLTVHVKLVGGIVEHVEFDTWQEVWFYARKPFFGKGSPEENAIVLQLADRFGLLAGGDLQAYGDKYLGLDCNGFVGNYLVHGHRERDWQTAEPMGTDGLASKTIGVILRGRGSPVAKPEDLKATETYIMGLVGSNGQVIEQIYGNTFGHIIVTHPGWIWDSEYREGKQVRQVPTMLAAESTGGVGLIEHTIQIVGARNGIFDVKRFSHPNDPPLPFKAYRVL